MNAPSGMFLNDTLGDCCIAAVAHASQVMFGASPTDDEVNTAFMSWCPPGGCNEVEVLERWRLDGFDGHKLGAWAQTKDDAAHIAGLAAAGCSYVTFEMFVGATSHCVMGLALDAEWFTCFSWGQVYKIPIADYRAGLRTAYTLSAKPPAVPKSWVWAVAAVGLVGLIAAAHLAGLF